jgi:hypothetical protein
MDKITDDQHDLNTGPIKSKEKRRIAKIAINIASYNYPDKN